MRSPLALPAAAAALLLGACTYEYSNPAEELAAGEVSGRVVADAGAGLVGIADVTVSLRNSATALPVKSRANGRFFLLGIMPGRHTVIFEKARTNFPPDPTNGWALTRDVDVTWGSDGQPEGVIVGDVRVRYPVEATWTVTVPASAGFTFGGSYYAVDEVTGDVGFVTQDLLDSNVFYVTFSELSVGPHRFRLSLAGTDLFFSPVTFAAGPQAIDVPAAQERQAVTLPPSAAEQSVGYGKLRFRVEAPAELVRTYGYFARVVKSFTTGPLESCSAYSDGTRECDVAVGLYDVTVTAGGSGYTAPPMVTAIVTSNQTTDLGTIYITDDAVTTRADLACFANADCGPGSVCSDGACTIPTCLSSLEIESWCSGWSMACFQPPYGTLACPGGEGVCGDGPSGLPICITGGSRCALGGVTYNAPVCLSVP
jgi:hypothetical protein